jgi:hypothetical protein
MSFNEIKKELNEIMENPGVLLQAESELESVLKEIIKIERRHIYLLDSTSSANRKKAVQDLLIHKLKNKEKSNAID